MTVRRGGWSDAAASFRWRAAAAPLLWLAPLAAVLAVRALGALPLGALASACLGAAAVMAANAAFAEAWTAAGGAAGFDRRRFRAVFALFLLPYPAVLALAALAQVTNGPVMLGDDAAANMAAARALYAGFNVILAASAVLSALAVPALARVPPGPFAVPAAFLGGVRAFKANWLFAAGVVAAIALLDGGIGVLWDRARESARGAGPRTLAAAGFLADLVRAGLGMFVGVGAPLQAQAYGVLGDA